MQKRRQGQLHPHHAKGPPHAHEHEVGATVDVEKGAGIVPGDGAEGVFHEPADEVLEGAPDDGADEEHHGDGRVVEAVERQRHEHGAEAVNGGEGPPQKAGAILVVAEVDHEHVVDGLDDHPGHRGDDEDPEQVEEVQFDIAAAGLVQAEGAVLGLFARLHESQPPLQLALVGQRRIHPDVGRDEDEGAGAEEPQARVHAEQQQIGGEGDDEPYSHGLGDEAGAPAVAAQEAEAENTGGQGAEAGGQRERDVQDDGEQRVVGVGFLDEDGSHLGERVDHFGHDGYAPGHEQGAEHARHQGSALAFAAVSDAGRGLQGGLLKNRRIHGPMVS